MLAGCAHDAPLPLPAQPSLVASPDRLAQAPATQGPMGVEQVVALALANNPDLKAARLRDAVARGQTKQAGILPNPQLTGAFLPLLSGVGTVPAWNVGLAQNLRAIITYRAHLRGARDTQQQVAADIVWQEWQTAGLARQLATDIIMGEQSRPATAETVTLLADRNARLEQAMTRGNATLAMLAPDRAALQAARAALEGSTSGNWPCGNSSTPCSACAPMWCCRWWPSPICRPSTLPPRAPDWPHCPTAAPI
jgi:outer membrane protein TolC